MDAWIRSLITSAVLGVKALADAAMARILWVYQTVVTIGLSLRLGWNWLVATARVLRDRAYGFGLQIHATLWYIIWVRIPGMISIARNEIVSWVVSVVTNTQNALTFYINLVRDWLIARLNEFLDLLRALRDWAILAVAEVWDTLIRVRDLVLMLLTDPARMAAWLFGALVGYIISFIDENADALLELFRSRATVYAGRVVARIESVLVRLL